MWYIVYVGRPKLVKLCQRDCIWTSQCLYQIYSAPDARYNTSDTKSRQGKLGGFLTYNDRNIHQKLP